MKQETVRKVTLSIKEIIESLKLSGEVTSCGFNTHKKSSSIEQRELTIIIKETRKKR